MNLCFSKIKKRLSIPRLEMMAILIALGCVNFVKTQIHVRRQISSSFLWSDSQSALKWISKIRLRSNETKSC